MAHLMTVNELKENGIGMIEARRMAADVWQSFENDSAFEENRKAEKITAKRQSWNDEYVSFAICENGEITEIDIVFIDNDGEVNAELAHFVIEDYC